MIFTPLLLSKIVIAGMVLALLYNLFQTIEYGRKYAHAFWGEDVDLANHKKYAKRSFWILILTVGVIDTAVHIFGNPVYDTLFWVHLCMFAVPALIFFSLIRFKFTGSDYSKLHWKLVYGGLLPTLVGTLLTGIPLLYRL